MLLHIGDNNLIRLKDIIGVFDIDILKENLDNEIFLNEIDLENKSLIISKDKNYFSNISVATIKKRIDEGIIKM